MNLPRLLPLAAPLMFVWFTQPGLSQTVITTFTPDGVLICSRLAPASVATVEWASSLGSEANWQDLQSGIVAQDGTLQVTVPISETTAPTFYRVRGTGWPANMALIPAGSFQMGDSLDGDYPALPVHSVSVSALYMDKYEVTKALWDQVYNWAITNGYILDYSDSGQGKASNHPAQNMTWYDAVKWCNARSEREGKTPAYYTDSALIVPYRTGQVAPYVSWGAGYRLPTEAEWEKAARGGATGKRFPWPDVDTITHSRANYNASSNFPYDVSPTRGYHPIFNDGLAPYTSPVGYFQPNAYGLYDMAGNVREWCWDWYDFGYPSNPQTDPHGPSTGWSRIFRGGLWTLPANVCRVAQRSADYPTIRNNFHGFRAVLPAGS